MDTTQTTIREYLEGVRGRADILAISDQPLHLLVSQDAHRLLAMLDVAIGILEGYAMGDGDSFWAHGALERIAAIARGEAQG